MMDKWITIGLYVFSWLQLLPFVTCRLGVLKQEPSPSNNALPWADYLEHFIEDIDAVIPARSYMSFRREFLHIVPNHVLDTQRVFSKTRRAAKFTDVTEAIGHESHFHLTLYDILTKRYKVSKKNAVTVLNKQFHPICQPKFIYCDPYYPYRLIDGSCNNLKNPDWGAAFAPFDRIIPAAYEDGFGDPRGGMDGGRLPNPRKISTTIHQDVVKPDVTITNMVPQIGQFLDHDLALAPEADRRCCNTERGHLDCWPIVIPRDDYFYSNLSKPETCMEFTRSTPFCFPDPSAQREQFNIVTSFMDASQVYGSDDQRGEYLRTFSGGRLLSHSYSPDMLPPVWEVEGRFSTKIPNMGKYLAGDERVNEMPALTTMHTLLYREHNRIAGNIEYHRPHWSDSEIFEESRRILIAEWQNVIYGEFLPVILGEDTMKKYNLTPDDATYSRYNKSLSPVISHAFATAAYRFGHTLVNGIIQLYRGLEAMGSYELKDNFFEPDQIERNGWDGYNLILGGLMVQNSQTSDPYVAEALTNHVLKPRTMKFGTDLVARNIQRGRDHGIPPYGEYRKTCNLTPLTNWTEIPKEISDKSWELLKTLYASPREIDLFTGGLSETPLPGALSGPTFNCLKAMQFQRLKYGDRFFFTHGYQAGSFGLKQLANIRARTLGDIICENSEVTMTTKNVFRTASDSNPRLVCNDQERKSLDFDLLLLGK